MKKTSLNAILAVVLALSGAVLTFLGFYTAPKGEVSDSVLWYFAQTLIYAATAFGMKDYIDYRLKDKLK